MKSQIWESELLTVQLLKRTPPLSAILKYDASSWLSSTIGHTDTTTPVRVIHVFEYWRIILPNQYPLIQSERLWDGSSFLTHTDHICTEISSSVPFPWAIKMEMDWMEISSTTISYQQSNSYSCFVDNGHVRNQWIEVILYRVVDMKNLHVNWDQFAFF